MLAPRGPHCNSSDNHEGSARSGGGRRGLEIPPGRNARVCTAGCHEGGGDKNLQLIRYVYVEFFDGPQLCKTLRDRPAVALRGLEDTKSVLLNGAARAISKHMVEVVAHWLGRMAVWAKLSEAISEVEFQEHALLQRFVALHLETEADRNRMGTWMG